MSGQKLKKYTMESQSEQLQHIILTLLSSKNWNNS